MRSVSPFGELDTAQWRHLAVHAAIRGEDGRWRFRYDPGIAAPFKAATLGDVDLRPVWNAVRGPALVIRGETSDLLTPDILARMAARAAAPALAGKQAAYAVEIQEIRERVLPA